MIPSILSPTLAPCMPLPADEPWKPSTNRPFRTALDNDTVGRVTKPFASLPRGSPGAVYGAREIWIFHTEIFNERFGNTSAIHLAAYLLVFANANAGCFIEIAPSYIHAIAFLCAPLTRHASHRSIASIGRHSPSRARRKRGLS